MNHRKMAIKTLEENGYTFKRRGGDHDIYYNPELKRIIPLKRHNFGKETLDYITQEIKQNQRRGS